ncbi:hypothetical protein Sjap_023896 [Stephania japonica]|uniref:Uncharacterized protein n=1 Tax=Stephania japonica TaxID=461633 RepID=A0AAP0HKZ8_9MAGN
MAALTCNTTISQTLAHENNTMHLRDASFSAYLSNSEEALMLKLGESMRKRSAIIIENPQEPLYQVSFGRKKTEDGEISVFGAEKYFNGAVDKGESRITVKARPKQYVKEHDDDNTAIDQQHAMQPRTKLGTPSTTCTSEVSWNSQSALLPALPSVPSPNGRIKANRSFFARFLCKYCYCSDDRAVDMEEQAGQVKGSVINANRKTIDDHHRQVHHTIDTTGLEKITEVTTPSKKFGDVDVNLLKENCFKVSTSKAEAGNVSFKRQFVEEARRTLEVFGSPIKDNEEEEDAEENKIALSLEKKLSMLTWDASPRSENTSVMTPNKGMNNNADNGDIESDSSSDLFEIKSFASNPMNPFLRRQPSDGMSGCMTPSSLASIDWSVATASAANFSVVTDYNIDPKLMSFASTPKSILPTGRNTNKKSTIAAKGMAMKDVPKRIPGMLSGCRNQKAVKVVGDSQRIPVKAKPEVRLQRSESFMEMKKVADPNVKAFELAHAQRAFGAPGAFAYLHSGPGSDSMFIR